MDGGKSHEARFDWQVFEPPPPPGGGGGMVPRADRLATGDPHLRRIGIDAKAEMQRRVRSCCSHPMPWLHSSTWRIWAPERQRQLRHSMLSAGQEIGSFIREFIRIAAPLPQDGLILDVRGNGGGTIVAGEELLQTMTPAVIAPERFHLINTPLVLQMCEQRIKS
jgi:hypothetical protein